MRYLLSLAAAMLLTVTLFAQQHVYYEFSSPNGVHHEAEISVAAEGLPQGAAIFRMSRSSPGRYATHEFGKNIYNIKATDKNGTTLSIKRLEGDVYEVTGHKGYVKVSYTLYGNYADGTYVGIDETGCHLNIPATFMWVKGLDNAPITIHFNLQNKNWKIATQLKPGNDAATFTAPGLQYFMDSPVKIGDLSFTEWTVTNPDKKSYRFRIAFDGKDPNNKLDEFGKKVARMVKQAQAVFGETPAYDYGEYTFLASINPYVFGDGMEHRNSTMITTGNDFTGEDNQLGVFSHEFFHCWNVERIRPKTIEPFNFEKSNTCDALWLAEGFTQYYGVLLLVRAGFTSPEKYLNTVGGLVNTKTNTLGAQLYSPIENSQRAVFVDAGVAVDKTNYQNMFTSYYTYGAALALALDLELRAKYKLTLDDFMRALWKKYGKTEIAYTVPGLEETLAQVTNDKKYAADFFTKYIYGHDAIDYAPLLANAGIELNRSFAGKAWLGNIALDTNKNNQLFIASNTIKNTPVYNAGLDIDDIIISIDGKNVTQKKEWDDVLAQHKINDVVEVVYKHRNETKKTSITLKESPFVKAAVKANVTESENAFRNAWLGEK